MAQSRDALAQVSVQLLGPFQVQQHGSTVTHFRGDKVRALLAYLAVEADQPAPDHLLRASTAVGVGGVEEVDTELEGVVHEGEGRPLVLSLPKALHF